MISKDLHDWTSACLSSFISSASYISNPSSFWSLKCTLFRASACNVISACNTHIGLYVDYQSIQFTSVTQSCLTLCDPVDCNTPDFPCPSPTPGAHSNSCPSSRWCHPTISSSIVPFSSCLQSFPASRSFQMSQFFSSGGQSVEVSASVSISPSSEYYQWLPISDIKQSTGRPQRYCRFDSRPLQWRDYQNKPSHINVLVSQCI